MNKKALVIGGTSGIGFSISKLFAQKNYNVTIVSSNIQNLEKALIDLKKINSNCSYLKCDLNNEIEVNNLSKTILNERENLNCVVFSSCKGLFGKIDEIEDEKFINYFNTFVVSNLKLLKNIFNKNNKTRIIYLSSYMAHFDIPNYNNYSLVKLTIDNFLQKLKAENNYRRILTVYPGSVETDFDEKSELIGKFKFRKSINKKSPDEVAEKIFKSYENYENVLHFSIFMKLFFFLKNIIPKFVNFILNIFFK